MISYETCDFIGRVFICMNYFKPIILFDKCVIKV